MAVTKSRPELPPPTVPPCVLFCDGVILEQGTGKTTLVGTYSGVTAATFPSPPKDLHIYVQLTSFVGVVDLMLVCTKVDIPEPREVYASKHNVRFRGKLVLEQVHFIWNQFQFPDPGEYAFQLWSQGHCLAEHRLVVRQKGGAQ
jgi:hypothetical protein